MLAACVMQICMTARRDTLVLPCAHLLYCHTCLEAASTVRARLAAAPRPPPAPPPPAAGLFVAYHLLRRVGPFLLLVLVAQADFQRTGRDRCPCCRVPIQGKLLCQFLSMGPPASGAERRGSGGSGQ